MKRLIVCLSFVAQLLIDCVFLCHDSAVQARLTALAVPSVDNAKLRIMCEVTMKTAPKISIFETQNFHFNNSVSSHE